MRITLWLDSDIIDTPKRYGKNKLTCYVDILQSGSGRFHNQFKGGVNLHGYLLNFYGISVKPKKWSVKLIFHFTHLALVNWWLCYCEDCRVADHQRENIVYLLDFRLEVEKALIKCSRNH